MKKNVKNANNATSGAELKSRKKTSLLKAVQSSAELLLRMKTQYELDYWISNLLQNNEVTPGSSFNDELKSIGIDYESLPDIFDGSLTVAGIIKKVNAMPHNNVATATGKKKPAITYTLNLHILKFGGRGSEHTSDSIDVTFSETEPIEARIKVLHRMKVYQQVLVKAEQAGIIRFVPGYMAGYKGLECGAGKSFSLIANVKVDGEIYDYELVYKNSKEELLDALRHEYDFYKKFGYRTANEVTFSGSEPGKTFQILSDFQIITALRNCEE